MNAKLKESHEIFQALHWHQATPENIDSLSTGTPDQKRTALAGLKSGAWGEWVTRKGRTQWEYYCDSNVLRLAVFAIYVGVSAKRAVSIFANIYGGGGMKQNDSHLKGLIIKAVEKRGETFASNFLDAVYRSRDGKFIFNTWSGFGNLPIEMVNMLDIAIPQHIDYIQDWVQSVVVPWNAPSTFSPSLESVNKRFAEHVQAGVALTVPAGGGFSTVVYHGTKQGLLTHEQAMDLIFSGLDSSIRPADRRAWIDALDNLEVTSQEICNRTQMLIPMLSSGDAAIVNRFAPALIEGNTEALLTEILLASVTVSTKKGKLLVLKAAKKRPCPHNAEEISPWLSMLAGDKDAAIAKASTELIKRWALDAESFAEEAAEIQELWRKTPDLWQVPAFEIGETTPEALTELAAEMSDRQEALHDMTTERFLAMANAIAYEDPEIVRTSLRGLRNNWEQFMYYMERWVHEGNLSFNEKASYGKMSVFSARDVCMICNLGKQPCLLSTPSRADLSITVSDLAARLALFEETASNIQESDLYVALARLDVHSKTPESVAALQTLTRPVLLSSKKQLPKSVGEVILRYIEDPVVEPALKINQYMGWDNNGFVKPKSVQQFPSRILDMADTFNLFPHFGDAVLLRASYHGRETGVALRQVACRATPLPPGAAVNLIAAQRPVGNAFSETGFTAVIDAWERGLLRPDVADIKYLDWKTGQPSNLASLAIALDEIAKEGILSVVWPVAEAILDSSVEAVRLFSGTAELLEWIEKYLPEVQFAISKGLAEPHRLDLPSIRILSERGGTSKAVSIAKSIAAKLPAAVNEMPKTESVAKPEMALSFEEVWPVNKPGLLKKIFSKKEAVVVDDGAEIVISKPDKKSGNMLYTISIPHIATYVYQAGTYTVSLAEGSCGAFQVNPDTVSSVETDIFAYEKVKRLYFDTKTNMLSVQERYKNVSSPLSSTLLTIALGQSTLDRDKFAYLAIDFVSYIKKGKITAECIRKAVQPLLQSPAVSPAKLCYPLEKDANDVIFFCGFKFVQQNQMVYKAFLLASLNRPSGEEM